ncbi:DEAD/DEAH box helicase [Aristophania vespae]|uniref:DEAD-box ATP-dependent RNA helicase RhpA n=2 Tax=Aristophania vespae TaxID=2697033 RepID=A0A6P1NCL8_9PROT|nr:DEAD/DEAH box helicase [Aristophania vespae]QHI96395.1 DEAD/DEAH box helicase [Aristophania vespae]
MTDEEKLPSVDQGKEEKPAPKKQRATRTKSTSSTKKTKKTAALDIDQTASADEPIELPWFSDEVSEEPKPKKSRTSKAATKPKKETTLSKAPSKAPSRRKKQSAAQDISKEVVASVDQEIIQDATQNSEQKSAEPGNLPEDVKDVTTKSTAFDALGLSQPILNAIIDIGYTNPTPIQEQAIPQVLAGHDVLGVAQTGTGKTASFTLPLLEKLSNSRARARMPRSLILEPTRELALQVADNFKLYGKNLRLNHALLIGGNSMNDQRDLLNRGVDVLIATPGRLIDLFDRGGLLLMQTDLLVIDEADRMLDMGFIPDIERIVSLLPRSRQTLFFSATMAPEIRRLADAFLTNPKEITVARQSSVATTITERLCIVDKANKPKALRKALQDKNVENAIIFCNRKRDVDETLAYLKRNRFSVGHLHGDLTQSLRFSTLERFRAGEIKILVCSDVAARGIDISGLSHVFNYDLPFNAEDYVHRIGRTGRAGKEGFALSFALPDEHHLLEAIEQLTGKVIEYTTLKGIPTAEWHDDSVTAVPKKKKEPTKALNDKEDNIDVTRDVLPENVPETRSSGNGEKKNHRTQSRKGLLPPMPEHDGPQIGFGSAIPAFMKISFTLDPQILSSNE